MLGSGKFIFTLTGGVITSAALNKASAQQEVFLPLLVDSEIKPCESESDARFTKTCTP